MRITITILVALSLLACAEDPGFMATRPAWQPAERPIGVCTHSYTGQQRDSQDAYDAVRYAIATINSRLDFDIYATSETGCGVSITVGVPAEQGWVDPGGAAVISAGTSGIRCTVVTANTGTGELLQLTLQHELGHCLGLAHDPWEGSIMRRVQVPTPDREFPPWISDSDRRLIRATYNHGH